MDIVDKNGYRTSTVLLQGCPHARIFVHIVMTTNHPIWITFPYNDIFLKRVMTYVNVIGCESWLFDRSSMNITYTFLVGIFHNVTHILWTPPSLSAVDARLYSPSKQEFITWSSSHTSALIVTTPLFPSTVLGWPSPQTFSRMHCVGTDIVV